MRVLLVFAVIIGSASLRGQQGDHMDERHARIAALYEQERYAEMIREVEAQIAAAPATTYADSLHRYLYKYGRAHRKLHDAAAGIAAAERVHGLVKERGIASHELEALFDLSWIYYEAGDVKQCARVDSIAVVVADGDGDIPYSQRGRARQYLAFDYSMLGQHRNSAKWALAAIAEYQKADTVPPSQVAESYTAVGAAYWHLGRIRDAESQYMKALEVLGDGAEEALFVRRVTAYGNLGVLWQSAGDLTRAGNYYQASLRGSDHVIATTTDQFTRDEAIVNRSRTYLNLATIYYELGDFGRARELLDMAYRDRSSVLEPDDPQLLAVKDRIADLEMNGGDLAKAELYVSDYLKACEHRFGQRSEEYIRAASRLGDIADRKGESSRADSLLGLSIRAGREGSDTGTNVLLAQTLRSRARSRAKLHRFDEARADLLEARRIVVGTYDSAHYKVATVDIALAETALQAGDAIAAREHARSALSILQDRIQAAAGPHTPKTFPEPHLLPDAVYCSIVAERRLSSTPKADWNDLIDLAIRTLARNKRGMSDEASKLLLIGAQKRLFNLAIDLAYEAYSAGDQSAIDRFLMLSEADRTILLKQRLNAFAGIRFSGVPDSIFAKEQELLAALDLDADDPASATELQTHERAYAGFLAKLENEYPAYHRLRYGEATIRLDELRTRLLKPGRRIISYARTDSALYALVIGASDARLMKLPATGLKSAVQVLHEAIAARDPSGYARAAASLGSMVYDPLKDLVGSDELLIIPDGELHIVNFEVLPSDRPSSGGARDHLLIERHAIAYLLSATTAVQFADLVKGRSTGTLALAPGFADEMKQAYLASVKDSTLLDRRFLRLVRQPFALRTAEDLARTMHAELMLGSAASEPAFRSSAARYGILHLGTHAEMNAASPMYSRLVLSKDGPGTDPDADGYLHAYEIYELDLRAQLAVLTACETGTGLNDGEGVRSLGYSFAYAGCPSLVMSLWSIDEKTSSEIIARFYEYLADGMPKHEALRKAKLGYLESASDELRQPYYWAGLILVGDVEPVSTERAWWPWLLVGLMVILAALLVRWGRKRERRPH
ncbi:MAG: CHAT domain-containing protein [Flavobacteriales bacterium]|nr:CHAT domain-containing protein [Flavobacteriales bacterium]